MTDFDDFVQLSTPPNPNEYLSGQLASFKLVTGKYSDQYCSISYDLPSIGFPASNSGISPRSSNPTNRRLLEDVQIFDSYQQLPIDESTSNLIPIVDNSRSDQTNLIRSLPSEAHPSSQEPLAYSPSDYLADGTKIQLDMQSKNDNNESQSPLESHKSDSDNLQSHNSGSHNSESYNSESHTSESYDSELSTPESSSLGSHNSDHSEDLNDRLGQYQLCPGDLGKGLQGSIKKGRHVKTNRLVAIKVMEVNDRNREFIYQEDRNLQYIRQKSQCPYLLRWEDSFFQDGYFHLVTEFIEGETLLEYIHRGPSFREQLEIIRQLIEAVNELHRLGIAHRDLKDINIMVRYTKPVEIVVIDFGFSCPLDESRYCHQQVGTPSYMAPEIYLGVVTDLSKLDVYSLAVTIVMILTGLQLFIGQNVDDLFRHVLAYQYNPKIVYQPHHYLFLPLIGQMIKPEYERPLMTKVWDEFYQIYYQILECLPV